MIQPASRVRSLGGSRLPSSASNRVALMLRTAECCSDRRREQRNQPPHPTNNSRLSAAAWNSTRYNSSIGMTATNFQMIGITRRQFGTAGSGVAAPPKGEKNFTDSSTSSASTPTSVDETLNKLFEDSQRSVADGLDAAANSATSAAGGVPGDALYAAAEQAALWTPTWYNLADQAIVALRAFHDVSGLEYGWSIVGLTVAMRLGLFPVMVMSQRTTSRMAHLQPELNAMKQRYEAIGTPSRQDQIQFGNKMRALFAKYEVKPLRGFAAPLIQMPLFMGMFFGLRKMPGLFPDELAAGGMYWFPDLTVPDPTYILPIAASSSFLALIELGKDQMMAQNPAQGHVFVNVFRVMAVAMVPVCITFESAMLCYWTANNALTLVQTGLLKMPPVKQFFGIWEPPKPVPGAPGSESLKEAATGLVKRMKGQPTSEAAAIEQHNRAVDARNKSFHMTRAAKGKRGITGKRRYR